MKFKFNKKNKRFIKEVIEKRYNILLGIIIVLFSVVAFKLFYVQLIQNEKYNNLVIETSENIVEGGSAPRGRIYDRNYNLLVDNIPVKTIYYKKNKHTTKKEELELANQMANMIELDYSKLNTTNLKEYYLSLYPDKCNKLITDEENQKLSERKLTDDDIYKLKLERITDEELNKFSEIDKKTAYIYYLMNNGYSYDEKVIKNKNVTEKEYALISEKSSELNGFNTKLDWERVYPYGDVFKTILGKVSSETQGIPLELKDEYLNNWKCLL